MQCLLDPTDILCLSKLIAKLTPSWPPGSHCWIGSLPDVTYHCLTGFHLSLAWRFHHMAGSGLSLTCPFPHTGESGLSLACPFLHRPVSCLSTEKCYHSLAVPFLQMNLEPDNRDNSYLYPRTRNPTVMSWCSCIAVMAWYLIMERHGCLLQLLSGSFHHPMTMSCRDRPWLGHPLQPSLWFIRIPHWGHPRTEGHLDSGRKRMHVKTNLWTLSLTDWLMLVQWCFLFAFPFPDAARACSLLNSPHICLPRLPIEVFMNTCNSSPGQFASLHGLPKWSYPLELGESCWSTATWLRCAGFPHRPDLICIYSRLWTTWPSGLALHIKQGLSVASLPSSFKNSCCSVHAPSVFVRPLAVSNLTSGP